MKQNIFPAIRLTLVMLVLCVGVYALTVFGIGKLLPGHGKGEMITDAKGKSYYANIGQKFDGNNYFNSRPSAVDYNAAGSGGSNKGPNNPELLKEVQERVNAFKTKNPGAEVPVDMVTASGSGLDPNISESAANAQIQRIAKARNLDEAKLKSLVESHIEKGVFGPAKVNVLKLNIALEEMK